MGNLANKCSCFNNDDKLNNQIETTQSIISSTIDTQQYSSSTIKELLFVKNTNSSIFKFSEAKNFNNLKHLQAYVKGWLLRIKYQKVLKKRLLENTSNVIKICKDKFSSLNLIKSENTFGGFDIEKWKKYYNPQEFRDFFYQFGLLLKTKIVVYGNNSYYIGTVNLEGRRCGYGELVNIKGTKFQGSWVNNIFSGWGRYIDEEGTLWEGFFKNGNLIGKGQKNSLNGSSYSGQFLNNLKHGFGYEITNDHIYEGFFEKDMKEGSGKINYKNTTDCYEGEFKNNLINGTGIYKWSNGDTYYGTFKDGKMDGKGVYKWPDGGQYEGEYVNNLKEGLGIFTWSTGKIFKGLFHLGRPHGQGKMVNDAETFDVTFAEGVLVKSNKNSKSRIAKNRNQFEKSLNAQKLIISESSINTKSTLKRDSTEQ